MPDGIPVPECHIGQEDVAEKLHPAVQGSCGAHSGHKAIKDKYIQNMTKPREKGETETAV